MKPNLVDKTCELLKWLCNCTESYEIPLLESSYGNIPSCSWPNDSSDVVKRSSRGIQYDMIEEFNVDRPVLSGILDKLWRGHNSAIQWCLEASTDSEAGRTTYKNDKVSASVDQHVDARPIVFMCTDSGADNQLFPSHANNYIYQTYRALFYQCMALVWRLNPLTPTVAIWVQL